MKLNTSGYEGLLLGPPPAATAIAHHKVQLLRSMQKVAKGLFVPQEMLEFIDSLILWLQNSLHGQSYSTNDQEAEEVKDVDRTLTFDLDDLSDDFTISKEGDVFKSSILDNNFRTVDTIGLTNKDTLLFGKFLNRHVRDGKIIALYSNGDYYNGFFKGSSQQSYA